VYLRRAMAIEAQDNAGALHDRLAALGADALLAALPGIADGTLSPEPQDAARAVYAKRMDKRDALIDWSHSALELERRVRAFNPWPVCETRCAGETLRIWEAIVMPEPTAGSVPGASSHAVPGTVLAAGAAGLDVATGGGVLRLVRVQRPGRRAI